MFNKVIIIGNLTRDVELKYLQSSSALATFGIASNRRYNKQDGTKGEETCFVDVKLFGRTAEVANQYLHKGSKVLVEGRLVYETWTDQNGQKRSKHSIVADSMQMMDNRNANNGGGYDDGYASQSNAGYGTSNNAYQNSSNYGNNTGANNAGYGNYGAHNQTAQNSQNYQRQPSEQNIPSIDIDDDDIPF